MSLEIALAYDRKEEIIDIFSEYMDMLLKECPEFSEFLEIQNYEEEKRDLEKKYGMPDGRIYIAYWDKKPAGCIAIKRFDDKNCELKRMYVRPEFRGNHIASKLLKKVIEDAVSIGYKGMLLDTLPFLETAIKMYLKFGFYEIERYNDSPMAESIYMKKDI